MDVERVKERMRRAWDAGDYSELSRVLEPASHVLCEACAVSAGQEVLDAAAGDGNFALAAARAGAAVVAADFSSVMVTRGRARARAEGLEVDWVEADVELLPFADARFDCVGSVFGAMIAPRPAVVAAELFRVARPGAAVGMVAWTADGFAVETFDVVRRHLPPPPELPLSQEWADEQVVQERFGPLAGSIGFKRGSLRFEAASAEAFAESVERSPAWTAARDALPEAGYAAMRAELVELARRRGGERPFAVSSEYLVTVARRPE